jgi:hypothetical protein
MSTSLTHPTSEFRRFYESISDRNQLALAIYVNGDWNDPEIADLVSFAATAASVEGAILQCLIGLDDEPEPTPARSVTPQQGAVPLSAAPTPSTSYNPFHPKAASETDPASSPCTHAYGDPQPSRSEPCFNRSRRGTSRGHVVEVQIWPDQSESNRRAADQELRRRTGAE